ncbi:hypothetical protein BH11ARM2_BH11ARM2_10700 [soil metagenome]
MRIAATALVALLAAGAYADRLISIPIGRKLRYKEFRIEGAFEPYKNGLFESYLAGGITTGFDLEVRSQRLRGEPGFTAADLSYNILSPIADLAPGASVGVQDALDVTRDGRYFYLAITIRKTYTTLDGDVPGDVTLGVKQGRYLYPFLGVSIPFSQAFRFIAEHDGIRPAAGIDLTFARQVGLRFYFRGEQGFVSLRYTRQF